MVFRAMMGVAVVAGLGQAALAETVTLRPVKAEWPASDREFPAGPGVDLVHGNCTACHSASMVLMQPLLTKATWLAEVNKMRTVYKAPVADANVEPIAAYLAGLTVGP